MKTILKNTCSLLLVAMAPFSVAANTSDEARSEAQDKSIHMFPESLPGYTRHVIRLPKLTGEARLELLPGKMIQADTCNRIAASVEVNKESIKGWGYSYLTISNFKVGGSTMMACPDGKAEVKVLASNNQLKDLRYNDRMPKVVFVEDGLSLDYKIWRVAPEESSIEAPVE